MNIFLGVMWFFIGMMRLRSGIMKQELFPSAPISLFIQTKNQPDQGNTEDIPFGVLYLMLGGMSLLTAIFHHH